jgi:hypothetical protein
MKLISEQREEVGPREAYSARNFFHGQRLGNVLAHEGNGTAQPRIKHRNSRRKTFRVDGRQRGLNCCCDQALNLHLDALPLCTSLGNNDVENSPTCLTQRRADGHLRRWEDERTPARGAQVVEPWLRDVEHQEHGRLALLKQARIVGLI